MKLFYRKYGEGQPLIILHGLFGQSDNWNSLAKEFSEKGFEVYTVDQRNHGLSPHDEEMSFQAMSEDLFELINDLNLKKPVLLGHSLGGKTVMQFAIDHPGIADKIIVADIATKYYAPHHQHVLAALNAVDFDVVNSRKEAEAILTKHIADWGTRQFLLKNIYWKDDGKLAWRFNLKVISEKIQIVGAPITSDETVDVPALFIRGGNSNYIQEEDMNEISEIFPRCMLETIEGAGHWVHAEKPGEFRNAVLNFIK
jgi:pimeloyl-ACP methyl ester carboxylesterase